MISKLLNFLKKLVKETKGQALAEVIIFGSLVFILLALFLTRMSFVRLAQIRTAMINYWASVSCVMNDSAAPLEYAKKMAGRHSPALLPIAGKKENITWELQGGKIVGGINKVGVKVPMSPYLQKTLSLKTNYIQTGNKIIVFSSLHKLEDMSDFKNLKKVIEEIKNSFKK